MKLTNLPIGHSGKITAVNGQGPLRCRLLDMGLTPRTVVSVVRVAPMGDPIEITVRGYELTIRKEDASFIDIDQTSCETTAKSREANK